MAAPSRPHHHATSLLSVYSAPVSESTTTHATHSRGELRHVNERAVSDRRTRLALPRPTEQPKLSHFTLLNCSFLREGMRTYSLLEPESRESGGSLHSVLLTQKRPP